MKKRFLFWGLVIVFIILLLAGSYKIMNARTFQFFGGLTSQVSTGDKVVAITFDDGPTKNVEDILPILEKYNAKATFFLIGNEMEKNPEEAKKIAMAGHQIGNHTYSHQRMVLKFPSFIKKEIDQTNELIEEAGYKGEIDFRPPNGKKLIGLPYYLHRQKNRHHHLESRTRFILYRFGGENKLRKEKYKTWFDYFVASDVR